MRYPFQSDKTEPQSARRRWLTILGVVVVAGLLAYGLY